MDVEEALYQHAAELGITLVTITQVGVGLLPLRCAQPADVRTCAVFHHFRFHHRPP